MFTRLEPKGTEITIRCCNFNEKTGYLIFLLKQLIDLDLNAFVHEKLLNFANNEGTTILNGRTYALKVQGKVVCAKAFASLHNMSYNTLTVCAQLGDFQLKAKREKVQ